MVAKIKNIVKKFVKKDTLIYVFLRKAFTAMRIVKNKIKSKFKKDLETEVAEKAVKEIREIREKNKGEEIPYIVFYHPEWLGVANSTKGLFKNYVGLMSTNQKQNRKKIIDAIIESEVKQIICSQLVDGWIELIQELKGKKPSIKIKVLWHANNYETMSDFTWGLNKKVIELYNAKLVDGLAFVKKTMAEFYKAKGYNAYYLLNNVKSEQFENLKKSKHSKNVKKEEGEIRVGIYNSHSRELKNVFTQIFASSLLENSSVDIVPSSDDIEEYVKKMGIKHTSINKFIDVNELMQRIQENDINIYPTFTECSPMFPMESFEMGVPCLIGNNNDYFLGSKLREYVCVNREDDPILIKNMILNVLENKEEIMKLYREWKKDFNKDIEKLVHQFING